MFNRIICRATALILILSALNIHSFGIGIVSSVVGEYSNTFAVAWALNQDSIYKLLSANTLGPTAHTTTVPNPAIGEIQITPGNSVTLIAGADQPFQATAYDQDGWPVRAVNATWRAERDGVASPNISSLGLFSASEAGTYDVTAEYLGYEASVNVVVIGGLNEVVTPIPNSPELCEPTEWNICNRDTAEDPENRVGNPANSTDDQGIASGNFSFSVPLLKSPGRGANLELSLTYNSRLWNKSASGVTYDINRGWPAPGWSLGFGKFIFQNATSAGTYVESDGTVKPQKGNFLVYDSGGIQMTRYYGHMNDGSSRVVNQWGYRVTDGLYYYSATVFLPNGTSISYESQGSNGITVAYPTRIMTRNGNLTHIRYKPVGNSFTPNIDRITDSLGRIILFHYDSNGLLTALTTTGISKRISTSDWVEEANADRRTIVRLHYKTLDSLGSNAAFSVQKHIRQDTPWVIDGIYFPGKKNGYWFGENDSYSPYGMIATVREQKNMPFQGVEPVPPSVGTTEQGVLGSGTTIKSQAYNFSEQSTVPLSNAPRYTKLTETWEGITTSPVETSFDYQSSATNPLFPSVPSRRTETTAANNTKYIQWSYRYPNLSSIDPNKFKDGLVYLTQLVSQDGVTILQSQFVDWEKGEFDTPRKRRVEITNEINQTISKQYVYGQYNQLISEKLYGFQGELIEEVRTRFKHYINWGDLWNGVREVYGWKIDLPDQQEVYNGAGTRKSATHISYDEQGYAATPGAVQNYWIHSLTPSNRGNISTIKKFSNAEDYGDPIIETRLYDVVGNNVSSTVGVTTTKYAYTLDTQYAYPTEISKGASEAGPKIVTSSTYDFETGLKFSDTDADGRIKRTYYEPPTLRPQYFISDLGAWETVTYDDVLLSVKRTQYSAFPIPKNLVSESVSTNNGLGKPIQKVVAAPGSSDVPIVTDTEYDKLGRAVRESRPHFLGALTYWKKTFYDEIGRVSKEVSADGSTVEAFYNEVTNGQLRRPDSSSINFVGQTQRIRDPWGNEKWRLLDPRGNLIEVVEPNPNGNGSVYETGSLSSKYTYDTLNKLVKIEQGAQVRDFKFDSLGRLTHKKSAEALPTLSDNGDYVGVGAAGRWSDVFRYQGTNLIWSKDARGVKTINTYNNDPLDRVQTVSYDWSGPVDTSAEILPASTVQFSYRQLGDLKKIIKANYAPVAATETPGIEIDYVYDSYGRLSERTDTVQGIETSPMSVGYVYDSLDRVTSVIYPKTYGMTGELRKIISSSFGKGGLIDGLNVDGALYASEITYNSDNQPTSMRIGAYAAHVTREAVMYDQITGLAINQKVTFDDSPVLDLSYEYLRPTTQLGITAQVTRTINNLDQNSGFSYEYDTLGRLKSVTAGWSQFYEYDRYGNRTSILGEDTGSFVPIDGESLEFNSASNRIITAGYEYDAAGNQTQQTHDAGTLHIQYDAAGRAVRFKNSAGQVLSTNFYAGDRRKFGTKSLNGTSFDLRLHCWDGDRIISEYIQSGLALNWQKNYVHIGDRLLATQERSGSGSDSVRFHHPDKIGTRLITDPISGASYKHTHLPFGNVYETETNGLTDRTFSSYQRDSLSGLDYAINRIYDPLQGRFTQVDPDGRRSISTENPQSLNQYLYVLNDPVNKVDPDGKVGIPAMAVMFGVGFVIGGLAVVVGTAISNYANDRPLFDGLTLASVFSGALAGGLFAMLAPIASLYGGVSGVIALGTLLGFGQYTLNQALNGDPFNGYHAAASAVLGGVGGAIAGPYTNSALAGGTRWFDFSTGLKPLSRDLAVHAAGYQSWDDAVLNMGKLNLMRGFGGSTVSNLSAGDAASLMMQGNFQFTEMRYERHLERVTETYRIGNNFSSTIIQLHTQSVDNTRRFNDVIFRMERQQSGSHTQANSHSNLRAWDPVRGWYWR